MKIALILVVILVIISADKKGGQEKHNGKEASHQDNVKKTEERANKQLGHDKAQVKENVENDHEKKNPNAKSTIHPHSKATKMTVVRKAGRSNAANHKGSTKTSAHSKNKKNHSPAQRTQKKVTHTHQTKGKEGHNNKKIEQNGKTKNIPHKINPKRQSVKNNANNKPRQNYVSTNQVKHIKASHPTKDMQNQVNAHQDPIANGSNVIDQKQTHNFTTLNSSIITAQDQEESGDKLKVQKSLANTTEEAVSGIINEEQDSNTYSEDESVEVQLSSNYETKGREAIGNSTKNKLNNNQKTKQSNSVESSNKTQIKHSATAEDNSYLIVKDSNSQKALPQAEANQSKVQDTNINQQSNKTDISKVNQPRIQANQSKPKQQEEHNTVITREKDGLAFHDKIPPNLHKKVDDKTKTVTIDANAYRESSKQQPSNPHPLHPKKQEIEDKKDTTQKHPAKAQIPSGERHLKIQQPALDDIDKLLKKVNDQMAKQKSKIADQIIDLQVKLHQKPTKETNNNDMTLYLIFLVLAILIAIPIIKCLTKNNSHPNPGQPMIQFQEEDSTRLSGPESGENLEEMQ